MKQVARFGAAALVALALATPAWAGVVGKIHHLPQDETWAASARMLMTSTWDADHSGAIDTPDEVAAIPCGAWAALDRDYRRVYVSLFGLRVSYGFVARADSTFVYLGDTALGIAPSVQIASDEAMSACGIAR